MPSVLIVCGHVGVEGMTAAGLCAARDVALLSRSTGTRGEREWSGHAGPLLADRLRARGVEVIVTNAIYDAALYGRDYDLVLALHLQRDRASARAFAAIPELVGVCNVPYIDAAARAKAQRWLDRFNNEYPLITGIPVTPSSVTANMTHLYGWDYPTAPTPCAIAECGHADLDAAVIFEPGVARIVSALATITLEYLEADLGLALAPAAPPPPTAPVEPFPLASFPVPGFATVLPEALEAAIADYCGGRAPVGWGIGLAAIAMQAQVRCDVAAALACHETGRFQFNGTDPIFSARPEWNNYGGLKTRDATATAKFPTMTAGLQALCAHIAWYAHPTHTAPFCNETADPRHLGPHRNSVHTLADFGNGNWNTGPGYGANVARHLGELRARIAAYQAPPAARRADGEIARELRALADELVRT